MAFIVNSRPPKAFLKVEIFENRFGRNDRLISLTFVLQDAVNRN